MTKTQYEKRLSGLRAYLEDHGLAGALITSYENRRYFCGFTGSSGYLIVTRTHVVLITDKRYTTQAKEQTVDCEIVEHSQDRLRLVADTMKRLGITSSVMESSMTAGEYFSLKEYLGDHRTVLEDEYFLELRMVKDEWETEAVREAIRRAEAGFDRLIPRLKTGMTEKDLADELHYLVNREGAEAMSFGTIVASGARGAMAHGFPTDKVIENGDMVVVDFGVMYDGYCSDMTRTLLFGDISRENMRIFNLVLEAGKRAVEAVRPGVHSSEVEAAHREVFIREGLDDYALRGLGHGIGLQIHECPRVQIGKDTVLKPNMIFTIEPGLYFPGVCGVRTEDDVLVTESGVENLSHTPHEIHID